MKNGTAYAAKLTKAYAKHKASSAKARVEGPIDPLHCLALGVLGVHTNESLTERALTKLCTDMAGWNEIRVSSPHEVRTALGGTFPSAMERAQLLVRALQSVFDREHRMSLDRLRNVGRREARQYLENLSGVDAYAVAYVILQGLGGHAIPVNDRLLKALTAEKLVHPDADRSEVQAFLERNVSAADAKEFSLLMRSFPMTKSKPAQRAKAKKTKKSKGTKKAVR